MLQMKRRALNLYQYNGFELVSNCALNAKPQTVLNKFSNSYIVQVTMMSNTKLKSCKIYAYFHFYCP